MTEQKTDGCENILSIWIMIHKEKNGYVSFIAKMRKILKTYSLKNIIYNKNSAYTISSV